MELYRWEYICYEKNFSVGHNVAAKIVPITQILIFWTNIGLHHCISYPKVVLVFSVLSLGLQWQLRLGRLFISSDASSMLIALSRASGILKQRIRREYRPGKTFLIYLTERVLRKKCTGSHSRRENPHVFDITLVYHQLLSNFEEKTLFNRFPIWRALCFRTFWIQKKYCLSLSFSDFFLIKDSYTSKQLMVISWTCRLSLFTKFRMSFFHNRFFIFFYFSI